MLRLGRIYLIPIEGGWIGISGIAPYRFCCVRCVRQRQEEISEVEISEEFECGPALYVAAVRFHGFKNQFLLLSNVPGRSEAIYCFWHLKMTSTTLTSCRHEELKRDEPHVDYRPAINSAPAFHL